MKLKTITKNKFNKIQEINDLEIISLTESLQMFDRDIMLLEEAENYANKYGKDNPIIQDIFGNILAIGNEDSKPNIFIRMWDAFIKWIKGIWNAMMNLLKKIFGVGTEEEKTIQKMKAEMVKAKNASSAIDIGEHFLKQTEEEITKEFLRIIATKKALNADKAKEAKAKEAHKEEPKKKDEHTSFLGLENAEATTAVATANNNPQDISQYFNKLKHLGKSLYNAISSNKKSEADKLINTIKAEMENIKKATAGLTSSGKDGSVGSLLRIYFTKYINVYEGEWGYAHKVAKYVNAGLPPSNVSLSEIRHCKDGYQIVAKYVKLNVESASDYLEEREFTHILKTNPLAKVAEEIKTLKDDVPKYMMHGVRQLGRFAAFAVNCLHDIAIAVKIKFALSSINPDSYEKRLKQFSSKWQALVNQTNALKGKQQE